MTAKVSNLHCHDPSLRLKNFAIEIWEGREAGYAKIRSGVWYQTIISLRLSKNG